MPWRGGQEYHDSDALTRQAKTAATGRLYFCFLDHPVTTREYGCTFWRTRFYTWDMSISAQKKDTQDANDVRCAFLRTHRVRTMTCLYSFRKKSVLRLRYSLKAWRRSTTACRHSSENPETGWRLRNQNPEERIAHQTTAGELRRIHLQSKTPLSCDVL